MTVCDEDILMAPRHVSIAATASADVDNQLERDAVSRVQRKFGRFEEVKRQGQQLKSM